jgi:hypothetical protein
VSIMPDLAISTIDRDTQRHDCCPFLVTKICVAQSEIQPKFPLAAVQAASTSILLNDCFWPKAAAGDPRYSEWRVSASPQKQPFR